MADGGDCGNRDVIIPYRKRPRQRACRLEEGPERRPPQGPRRIERALARMKSRKILRDYRRAAVTLTDSAFGDRPSSQHRLDLVTANPSDQLTQSSYEIFA
ncbi:hypothetical protein [Asanoa hainanensis]|uniref:hypothetical protein n=1 Tax=Asanoa hainanensis TaxID=560556 RepID=UPI00117C0356